MRRKITIIGCGNAGLVHAAKLIERGHGVCLLKTSNQHNKIWERISETGELFVNDATDVTENQDGTFMVRRPVMVTKDVKKAVEFGNIIMVMTTTLQHESVAKMIASYVRDGQLIVLVPGYMGSLIFKHYVHANVVYAECETTAYNGRIIEDNYVRISFRNVRNAVSTLPSDRTSEVLKVLSDCFDNTHYARKNILESALHNPNMIVHPIGLLFSAARIEHSKGDFWMYREGFTPSIVNVIREFDIAKNKVLEALGCEPLGYFEAARWRNTEDLSQDALTVFQSFAESSNIGPCQVDHRYLREDVPMGIMLLISIAKVIGIDVRLQEGIVALASALLKTDLQNECRTIQRLLGKTNVSTSDIINSIR